MSFNTVPEKANSPENKDDTSREVEMIYIISRLLKPMPKDQKFRDITGASVTKYKTGTGRGK